MSTRKPIIKEKLEENIYKHTQATKVNYYYNSNKMSRDGQRMNRAFDTLEEARAYKKEIERIDVQKSLNNYKVSLTPINEFPINIIEILHLDLTSCVNEIETRLEWLFENTIFNKREVIVFYNRFKYFYTLEEVAKALGVTRERIRQIEHKCLAKLRRFTRYLELGEYASKLELAKKEYNEYITDLKEQWTYESAKEFIEQYKKTNIVSKSLHLVKEVNTVQDLDLSVRAYNCLRRAGVETVLQLVQISEEDLMKVRNMGKKSLKEIKNALARYDLELPEQSVCKINKRGYWTDFDFVKE